MRIAMRMLSGAICCAMLAGASFAAEPQVIPLWPGAAPGSEGWNYAETAKVSEKGTTWMVSNVTKPTLTAYFPETASGNKTAIVVCPGGGFRFLSIDNEGADVARWLNSIGVIAFVLKYRVMRTGDGAESDTAKMAARRKEVIPLAIADGQQAIRLVREHAAEWGIAPGRIGVMGFSAGGYVATALALRRDSESRPNFAAPIYPGTPEEIVVPEDAPPIFLVHADDDKVVTASENSVRLYEAWKKRGLSAELHVYSNGGHGFGMRKRGLAVDSWPERFKEWLAALGLLKAEG
jgi:acetyl esterase/lipase